MLYEDVSSATCIILQCSSDRSLSQLVIKDKDKSQLYSALGENKPQVDIIEFE